MDGVLLMHTHGMSWQKLQKQSTGRLERLPQTAAEVLSQVPAAGGRIKRNTAAQFWRTFQYWVKTIT